MNPLLPKERLMDLAVNGSPEVANMANELLSHRRGVGGQIEPSTISPHAHHLLRQLDALRVEARMPIALLARKAGFANISWHHWTSARRVPRLHDLEAAANVLSHTITLERIKND